MHSMGAVESSGALNFELRRAMNTLSLFNKREHWCKLFTLDLFYLY